MIFMHIPDNILKKLFNHVVFVIGTNCGGKTTMAKTLAKRQGKAFYSADDHYWDHRALSDEHNQPQMNRPFLDWKEYFSRDAQAQAEWLYACEREEMPFIFLDLVKLVRAHPEGIVADVHCVPEMLLHVSDGSRIVAMTATDALVRREYFGRDDKNPLLACIHRETTNPDEAKANVEETAVRVARIERHAIEQAGVFVDQRTDQTELNERLARVEIHLGWRGNDD